MWEKDAYSVLRLLELGRGVIAGLLMDMRGDISDLRREHPGRSRSEERVHFTFSSFLKPGVLKPLSVMINPANQER